MHRDKTLQRPTIIVLILTLSTIFAAYAAAETVVGVDAPDFVTSTTFDAEITVENAYELDSGEFCLLFDPNVVNVTGVTAGDIGNMNIGFTGERCDTTQCIGVIRAVFDISGTSGASGSGSIATVGFEVTGSDGTCSILNISNTKYVYLFNEGGLWDGSAEEIDAKWENDIVCIGDSSLFDDPADSDNSTDSDSSTDSDTLTEDTPEARVTIFVENRDDDELGVYLYIDGDYEMYEEIRKDSCEEYYDGRRLTEGVHTFKIEWHDHDTDKDYVKIKECSVSGITAVTLMTDEHTEDDDKISAHVYVKNLDDDDLDVYLYIDEVYTKYKDVSSDSIGDYGEYEFEEDEDELHAFKIEWFDPGTGEDYEKIVRSYITSEEAVTLYIDKHTEADIVVLPDETPTPIQTTSMPATTSTRRVKESSDATHMNTPESVVHTDPELPEDSTEAAHSENGITLLYTLVGFIAAVFALFQIGRS